jgi:hypothetical protein
VRSRQPVIPHTHRSLVAGRVHGDRGLRDLSPCRRVVVDRHVPRPSNIDRAAGLDAIELAGVVCGAANETLADGVADDFDAVGVADENRVDIRVVDVVALDRHVAVLNIVLKALCAFGKGHADIDGAERAAAGGQRVGAGDAVGETIVSEHEVLGKA